MVLEHGSGMTVENRVVKFFGAVFALAVLLAVLFGLAMGCLAICQEVTG
jgi:hypothetical protein